MRNTPVGFGWVIQPAHLQADERATLRADNQKFLDLIRDKFQTVWFEDHFEDVGRYKHHDRLEGWTHLCYLLPQFPELHFGTLVLGQSYRNPALVAKMASTLQYLSNGRLILGIGAGWHEAEYRSYGWRFPPPGERVRQLDEYTQIVRLMLRQSPVSFAGKYYTIKDAHNDPLPETPIPLMIGGSGERGTLRTAAQYGDWWNFGLKPAEEFASKCEVLKQHCVEVGRDFDEIVLSVFQFISLSEEPSRVVSVPGVHVIGGNADAVTRELESFIKLGARHFMLRFADFPRTEGVELFLQKVLPRLRPSRPLGEGLGVRDQG